MNLLTQAGVLFDYRDPTPSMVVEADLARALAHANRFAGHTPYPYSVAQHSIAVSQYLRNTGASPRVQFAGLMHDCHEAYFGDVPTPLKRHLGIKDAENKIQAVVLEKFGLTMSEVTAQAIKLADTVALYQERECLFNHLADDSSWDMPHITPEMLSCMPKPCFENPIYVRQQFLDLLEELRNS